MSTPRHQALVARRESMPARSSAALRPRMLLAGLLLLCLGGGIGWAVRNGHTAPTWDLGILETLSHGRDHALVRFSEYVEFWDGPKATPWLLLAALVAVFAFGHRLLAVLTVLLTLLAWTPGHIAKTLFPRDRPPASVEPVLHVTGPNSFPSGHTGFILAATVGGAFCLTMLGHARARRWWVAGGLLLVPVVAWSRMYLAVHFPTDVLGGALLSAGSGLVLWPPFAWLYAAVERRWPWWTR